MKTLLALVCVLPVLFVPGVASASTSPCSTAQYDMLEWVSMLPSLSADYHMGSHYYARRNGNEIIQMKGAAGYPWDVDIVDSNYIYQWITENVWGDPTTYKAFVTPTTMPWMPRCIDVPETPGKIASITVPSPAYSFYGSGCSYQSTSNLGNTVNEIWGPYNNGDFGGSLPSNVSYLELSYRYSCDSSYDNCSYKEVFDFVKDYGLVRWTYYALENGTYEQQNQTFSTTFGSGGAPAPNTPCFD